MKHRFRVLALRGLRQEDGATAIEYGLIAGLISVVIITSVGFVGSSLQGVFDAWSTAVESAIN